MTQRSLRRRAGITALLSAGLLGSPLIAHTAGAGLIASFEASGTVDVGLSATATVPAGVTVDYDASVFSRDASHDGALSSASSDPLAEVFGDATFQSHADTGQAGARREAGVPTGLADASSSTDGYITVSNNSGAPVDLTFDWAVDALVKTALTTLGGPFDASASAFFMVTIATLNGTVLDTGINAVLADSESDSLFDSGQFTVSIADGDFEEISILVESGGTASAVPVPPTLALLPFGLAIVRATRRRAA